MKQYTIFGTEKPETASCKSCNGGEKLNKESYFKTDNKAKDYRELICGECNTKYKIPYKKTLLEVNTNVGVRITTAQMDNFNRNLPLNDDTLNFHALGIAIDFEDKVFEMEQKDCNGTHEWIESYPFKTSEGSFTMKSCLNCKEGTLNYKGTNYGGSVMELVSFVSSQGIEYDKALKEDIVNMFDDTYDNLENAKELINHNLFDDVIDTSVQTDTTPNLDWGI